MDSRALFEILAREHSGLLRVFLRAAGCPDDLLDEVWQETMIVAWRKLDQYDQSRPFGAWLRGIASRVLLAQRRLASRIQLIGDDETLEYLSEQLNRYHQLPGDTLDDKLAALRDCISKLPAHEKSCIEMRFQQDLMPASISEKTGEAIETIKKRLVRAKSRLLECIENKLKLLPS
ncbi:MAG: sigma-70 family RNA polymerase sigma factor [Pirellulales bacterium]